jgi:hypothetical protein
MPSASSNIQRKFKVSATLISADDYQPWRAAVQTQLFAHMSNTNMASITSASTLDAKFFKIRFNDEWRAAAADDAEPFDDPAFVQHCLSHALTSGEGFTAW